MVAELLEGLLSKEALSEVDAHVDRCEGCRLLLSSVAPLLGPAAPALRAVPSQYTISQTIELDRIKWSASMRVGSVLKDKWRLDRLLGVGGTAAVYEATHKNHGGRVAIKLIHAGLELDPDERRRFLREGYAANAVGHPGIVRVIDDDVDEGGSIFLVSELVDGETLHARLGRMGRLPAEEVLGVAYDVLDVLAAAHERGIIHRDIKPENILAGANGETKLLDFGMALVRGGSSETTVATSSGVAFGTPAFMPPEQALGLTEQIGPRSDIWALGATMFTLMSGRLVHDARTVTDAIVRTVKLPAPSLASVLPDAHEEVCRLVDRALGFDPHHRWATAREMQAATREVFEIVHYRRSDGAEAAPLEPEPLPRYAEPPSGAMPPLRNALAPKDQGQRAWLVAAAALVGAAATATWWTVRDGSAQPSSTSIGFDLPALPETAVPPATSAFELGEPPSGAVANPSTSTMPFPPTSRPPKSPTHVVVKHRPTPQPSSVPSSVGSSWLDRRTR